MKNSNAYYHILRTVAVLQILSLAACKEEAFSPMQTREFSIPSVLTGATYNIKVGLPSHFDASTGGYAAIYVLDGEENFALVANQCQEISNARETQNVLVVSIGYGRDRNMDYTPTATGMGTTGGAPEFLNFIKNELIPKMEQDFGAATTRESRTVLGHSFGGLFATYAFAHDNDLFGNYIMLSPSIWYDNEVVLKYESQNRAVNKDQRQLVYLGQGEMENAGRMQAPFEAFYEIIGKNYSDVRLTKNLEKQLDHVGSKNPNIRKGLNFYFQNR